MAFDLNYLDSPLAYSNGKLGRTNDESQNALAFLIVFFLLLRF